MKLNFRKNNFVDSNHSKTKQRGTRHISLLKFVLIALCVTNILYAIINIIFRFHEHYIAIGILELAVGVVSLLLFIYYQKTKQLTVLTYCTIFLLSAMLIIFFALSGSGKYSFFWMSIYPPVVYFLLGTKKANIIVGLFFAYQFVFMLSPNLGWESTAEHVDSLVNIVGASAGLVLLTRYFDVSRSETERSIEEKNKELEELIQLDYLTGIYNRIKLDTELSSELKGASTSANTFSIIMADLDDFKRVNDTFGHLVGDSVLTETAQVLKKGNPQTNIIGRWGGEEFLIICPKMNKSTAKALCEQLLQGVLEHQYIIEEKITISFGLTEYINGDSIDTIVRRADKALYYAKENGKCRVETM